MRQLWRNFTRQKLAVAGIILLGACVAMAVAAPLLATHDPKAFSIDRYVPPGSPGHPLGTDNFGRDLLSRIIYGARVAFLVGVLSAGISAGLGIVIGAIPGYFGGVVDEVISRFVDIFLMIPVFFLLILATSIFGSNIYFVMFAIGITTWPANARIMRSQVLTLKTRPYVKASIAAGASATRVLVRHIIPNGVYPVIANTALQMGSAILTEAGLSFLGLGDPNVVSWGQMIQAGQRYMNVAWWMVLFPGLALLLLVAAFNLTGDGLNYAFNPRLQRRAGA
jgi:peptide/nickel transport system permease protein